MAASGKWDGSTFCVAHPSEELLVLSLLLSSPRPNLWLCLHPSLPQIKRIKPQRQQNNVFMSFTEHSACECRWETRRAAKRSRSRGWTHAQLLRVAALRTPPSSSISPSPLALMKTDASLLLFGNAAFWLVGSEAAVFLEFSLDVCFSSPHLTVLFFRSHREKLWIINYAPNGLYFPHLIPWPTPNKPKTLIFHILCRCLLTVILSFLAISYKCFTNIYQICYFRRCSAAI